MSGEQRTPFKRFWPPGVRCALTGGLAIAAQLGAHGRPVARRALNDIDLIVHEFSAIPESVTASFLLHHVHPDAD
jgi:hypothetical protein